MAANDIADRERADALDLGFCFCEGCGTTYIPHPGYANNGHQCHEDGTADKYEIRGCQPAHLLGGEYVDTFNLDSPA